MFLARPAVRVPFVTISTARERQDLGTTGRPQAPAGVVEIRLSARRRPHRRAQSRPVPGSAAERLRQVRRCYATLWADPGLRRLVVGMTANVIADQALLVALAIYAHQLGGAALMGTVALVQMSVAAAAAPLFGRVAARRSCRLVLGLSASGAAALMTACALATATGAPLWIVVTLATAARTATGAARPSRLALAPRLARTSKQLEASNVASGGAEGVAYLAGPALAGASMALWSPAAAMVVAAMGAAGAAWAAAGLPEAGARAEGPAGAPVRATEGFRELLGRAPAVALLFATQTFVRGLLNVLIVIAAVDLLGQGASGAGALPAFLGVGGLVGSLVVAMSSARRRAAAFAVALVAWGAPLAMIGLVPDRTVAALALFVIGVANVGVDVHGFTLLQEALPGRTSPSAFAALESLMLAGVGVGSMAGGVLVRLVGVRAALGVAGMVLPLAVVVGLPSLFAVGRRLAAGDECTAGRREVPALVPFQRLRSTTSLQPRTMLPPGVTC